MLGCFCYHHWACYFAHGNRWNQGNNDGIRELLLVSTGIRVTKDIAKSVVSYTNYRGDQNVKYQ